MVGASLVFLLIWLPAALMGDNSVITDPLVYMGLPIIVISSAMGALIGVPASPGLRDSHGEPVRRPSPKSRAVVVIAAGTAVLLATWFFLMATGAVGGSPL